MMRDLRVVSSDNYGVPLFLQGIIPIEGIWWKESDYGEELPGYPERAVTEVICNTIVTETAWKLAVRCT